MAGTAHFEQFGKSSFELAFDAELSTDPRGGGQRVKASGSARGGASVVCIKDASNTSQGEMKAQNGTQKLIESARDTEACRALIRAFEGP